MLDADQWPYLVVLETQKVKSYLLASPILRETRGASLLLDLCNRKKIKEDILSEIDRSPWEIIYLGGGSGRVLFKNPQDAEQFRNDVLDLYRRDTAAARVAVEIVDCRGKSLPEGVAWGVNQCKKNKLGRAEGVPMLAGRWIRPCSSCGQEPAEARREELGTHFLCRGCRLKRDAVKKLYTEVEVKPGKKRERVLKTAPELGEIYGPDFIYTTLARYLEGKNRRLQLPQDFDEIGTASSPGNYLGLIYADGNRMGELWRELGQLLQGADDAMAIKSLRAFSHLVDKATREAAVEAVLTVVGTCREIVVSPEVAEKIGASELHSLKAEFLLAGGDDLMLAVPAHCALDVALRFIDYYQDMTKKLIKEYKDKGELPSGFAPHGLTTSAGVVIAHAHFPASDLRILAEELMKLAKKKAASFSGAECTGTLDFLVVSEAVSESVRERRRREYVQTMPNLSGAGTREVKLTERPYTAAEAANLLKLIRALKQTRVPRTKLKALYPVLFHHPLQAQFDALRIKERLQVTGALEAGSPLYNLVIDRLKYFPFQEQDSTHWSTPLTDILELYDFVHDLPGGADSATVNPSLPEVADVGA